MKKTIFYFGGNVPAQHGGGTVTDQEFSHFLQFNVCAYFPGFTVKTGIGYWQGVCETVRIVEILHFEPFTHDLIEGIAIAYRNRFMQESVLIETIETQARLI